MRASRLMAAAFGFAAVFGATVTAAQVAYVPPNTPEPRFGGVFRLSQPGPVAGYWPTQCRVWDIQMRQNRQNPNAVDPSRATLQRFIGGLIANRPNFDDLSPAMAEDVRRNMGVYWPTFNRMGNFSVAKPIGQDAGNTVYVVNQTGGQTHWYVSLTGDGKVDRAFLCPGQGA